jgi:anti-sigma factor (TIGR02949 family)
MYSCKDSIHALLDFLDGEMTPDEQRHLEEHLDGCPPCVDFVRSYRATPAMCKRALAARMPEELAEKLTSFLRSRVRKA